MYMDDQQNLALSNVPLPVDIEDRHAAIRCSSPSFDSHAQPAPCFSRRVAVRLDFLSTRYAVQHVTRGQVCFIEELGHLCKKRTTINALNLRALRYTIPSVRRFVL